MQIMPGAPLRQVIRLEPPHLISSFLFCGGFNTIINKFEIGLHFGSMRGCAKKFACLVSLGMHP